MAVAEVVATAVVEVAATLGLEVAAAAGSSLDAEVAAGSEVAGVAAAGSMTSGSVTSGSVAGVGGPAAYPGERAACAKSHDLTAGLTEDAVIGLEVPQAPKRRLRS